MKSLVQKFPFPLLCIVFCYFFSQLFFFWYSPLWDAQTYFLCVIAAVQKPFNIFQFDCFGHPSWAITIPYGIVQYIKPGNIILYHISLCIITGVTIGAFYYLLTEIFDKKKYGTELFLLTTLFAFFPFFYVNGIQMSLEQGILLYFILSLYFLLKKQFFISSLFITLLIFTKETGFIIAIILVFFCITRHLLGKQNITHSLRPFLFLIIPFILFGIYIILKVVLVKNNILWVHSSSLDLNPVSPIVFAYFNEIFVLNGMWIFSGVIFLGLISFIWQVFHIRNLHVSGIKSKNFTFVFFVFFPLLFGLTLPKTFSNIRYFLPLYALLLIYFFASLLIFKVSRLVRTVLLVSFCIFFFFSNFILLDPLSKMIYGTFRFGNYEMLDMTSLTHECCGYGQDQLVYNTQFAHMYTLQTIFFHDVNPTRSTYIIFNDSASWSIARYIPDVITHKNILPQYLTVQALLSRKNLPHQIYFIMFPNMDNKKNFLQLQKYYRLVHQKIYWDKGYSLSVMVMEERFTR